MHRDHESEGALGEGSGVWVRGSVSVVAGCCFEDVEGERGESSRAVGPGGVGGARRAEVHVGVLGRDAGEREGDAAEEARRAGE